MRSITGSVKRETLFFTALLPEPSRCVTTVPAIDRLVPPSIVGFGIAILSAVGQDHAAFLARPQKCSARTSTPVSDGNYQQSFVSKKQDKIDIDTLSRLANLELLVGKRGTGNGTGFLNWGFRRSDPKFACGCSPFVET